jgi:hypothetical protein
MQSVPDWRAPMIKVLRIWGSTVFDINLMAARRMVKMVLTAILVIPIEELAATCQPVCQRASDSDWRKLRVGTIVTWELSHVQTTQMAMMVTMMILYAGGRYMQGRDLHGLLKGISFLSGAGNFASP